ncbi:hypothetical protein ACWEKR_05965 [Nocardia sp. NPDC004573]
MTTPADAAKVLAKCACYDPMFSKPDAALAVGWAEAFSRYDLPLSDLLEAVTAHYCESSERAMPASLIRLAREIRRVRGEREKGDQEHHAAAALPPGAASTAQHRAAVIADFADRLARRKAVPPLYTQEDRSHA